MDVVYILGDGSKWNDNEFKYSLRSVAKYLKNFSRVVVIGSLPRCNHESLDIPFLFIPYADRDGDKQQNARSKLLHICNTAGISERFLLMNDDFFFLKDCTLDESFPYFRMGTITQHIAWRENNPSNYLRSLRNTEAALKAKGLPLRDYEVHGPIVYDKTKLRQVLTTEFNWDTKHGMLIRSVYANFCQVEGTVLSDLKIDSPQPRAEIERKVKGRLFFSIGDGGLNKDMRAWLEARFPGSGKPKVHCDDSESA